MPPPKYNPSSYTAKKPKRPDPTLKGFLKDNKKFGVARSKEWDFQRAGHTQSDNDDLAGSLSKMSISGNSSAKK
jgi:hypothetical protein